MSFILKNVLPCGLAAALLVWATPGAATYWWSWDLQPDRRTVVEERCRDLLAEFDDRSRRLLAAMNDTPGSHARYAYSFHSHAWSRGMPYWACEKLLSHPVPTHSRK